MTGREAAALIGKRASVPVTVGGQTWNLEAEILDTRERYGRIDWQVTPTHGHGPTVWVSAERCRLVGGES